MLWREGLWIALFDGGSKTIQVRVGKVLSEEVKAENGTPPIKCY